MVCRVCRFLVGILSFRRVAGSRGRGSAQVCFVILVVGTGSPSGVVGCQVDASRGGEGPGSGVLPGLTTTKRGAGWRRQALDELPAPPPYCRTLLGGEHANFGGTVALGEEVQTRSGERGQVRGRAFSERYRFGGDALEVGRQPREQGRDREWVQTEQADGARRGSTDRSVGYAERGIGGGDPSDPGDQAERDRMVRRGEQAAHVRPGGPAGAQQRPALGTACGPLRGGGGPRVQLRVQLDDEPVRNGPVRQAQPAGGRGESGGHQAHGGQPSAQESLEIVEIADAAVDDRRLDTAGVRVPAGR